MLVKNYDIFILTFKTDAEVPGQRLGETSVSIYANISAFGDVVLSFVAFRGSFAWVFDATFVASFRHCENFPDNLFLSRELSQYFE